MKKPVWLGEHAAEDGGRQRSGPTVRIAPGARGPTRAKNSNSGRTGQNGQLTVLRRRITVFDDVAITVQRGFGAQLRFTLENEDAIGRGHYGIS